MTDMTYSGLGIYAVLARLKDWRAVMKPCGTPNCESPTCRLIYAYDEMERLWGEAHDEAAGVIAAVKRAAEEDGLTDGAERQK